MRLRTMVVGALGAAAMAGCASNRIQAQWSDPSFAQRPLHGGKVLVACTAADTAARRICQDDIAARLVAAGVQPLVDADRGQRLQPSDATDDARLERARAQGAQAVFAADLSRASSVAEPNTRIGIGVGSVGWGSGVGGGVGVSVPVGSSRLETVYAANMTLTDVATGKLMWTAKVVAPASADVGGQIKEIAKSGVAAAQDAGMF